MVMGPDQSTLVVVADRETARFFRHARPGAYLEAYGEDIRRPSPGDPNSDRPGRSFESAGATRHAMEPPTHYQDNERRAMAQAILERVTAAIHADEVDRVALLAEPKLLGELRHGSSKFLRERVVLELDSHLTQATSDELAKRLTDEVALGLVRSRPRSPPD